MAGWSSLVAHLAHNQKVAGSNPAPASSKKLPARWRPSRNLPDMVQGVHKTHTAILDSEFSSYGRALEF